ncbi:helix-turn-helix domain-containing protein [Methylobacterium sp. E-065]|uniref:helix-turn-helix domain-containing protein n=1 Tax=Methylobacterium sp. E-065 TaxID=2836583 RepID=UPI001FBA5634|nr:helix-turn-helix domain-containing protein [Methylobacterium sp. E-065]MCJ2016949.1 helix-turn-helix domain-containing protein [Methylobacterium sp. E-065]
MNPRPAPLLNTVAATQSRLGLGRTKVLALVKAQDLEAVKVGRRTLVTEASIERLVDRLPRVGAATTRISK